MNKKLFFTYCHGGGGSWLGNLVWHLYNNNFTLTTDSNGVFDGTPLSNPLMTVGHAFEYFDPQNPLIYTWDQYEIIRFGTGKPFQLYLNEVKKIRFLKLEYDKLSFIEQFDRITNAAKAWMTDPVAIKYYCNNLDLDLELLFVDNKEFVNQLFTILDRRAIPYAKNIDYCMKSITNYKNSCPNPKDHIGNTSSLSWLAWCHAIMMINKLTLPSFFDFSKAVSLEQIAEAIEPIHDQCLELSRPWYFLWNENE